jgi:hypothetical protein
MEYENLFMPVPFKRKPFEIETKSFLLFLVFLVFLVPIGMNFFSGNIDLGIWWLGFTVISSLLPIAVIAYLSYPAKEGLEHISSVIETVNKWIKEWETSTIKEEKEACEVAKSMVKSTEERIKYVYGVKNYIFPFLLICLVSIVGWFLVFTQGHQLINFAILDELILEIPSSILIGFVGGWFYSFYGIVNRYRTADIPPGFVIQCASQMLFAGAVAYFATTVSPQATKPIFAFCVGFIPYAALSNYLRLTASSRFGIDKDQPSNEPEKDTSINTLEGLGREDVSRLREDGILTIHHLANANPITMYLVTSYRMSQIIDWVNIAYLRKYIDKEKAEGLKLMGILGAIGIASVEVNSSNAKLIGAIASEIKKNGVFVKNLITNFKKNPKIKILERLWVEFSGT